MGLKCCFCDFWNQEQMARENVGVALTDILQNACGVEKSSVLSIFDKLQAWRGPIGKQLASPYAAKVEQW